MCSHCDGHPDEQNFVNAFNKRRQERVSQAEPVTDALGQDLLQSWLEVACARFLLNSTRNLIGHVYGSSPLVGVRKVL